MTMAVMTDDEMRVLEAPPAPDGMQPADEAPELAQRRGVLEFGLAAGAACRHGPAVAEARGQCRRRAQQPHAGSGA